MNKYDLLIEDVYDRSKTRNVTIHQLNAHLAHKDGLNHCNALREEIAKITSRGKVIYALRAGFLEHE